MTATAAVDAKGGKVVTLGSSREGNLSEKTQGLLNLPFTTLSAAMENVPAEPDWIWNGYLAPGAVTVFAAPPKAGKTTTLFGLFQALTQGGDFIGRPTRKASVLLLTEERRVTLRDKVSMFAMDGDLVHLLTRQEVGLCPWDDLIATCASYCAAHGIGVLVIDTWDRWAAVSDENDSSAVNAALLPLQRAAYDSDLAVVVVHHHRKAGGQHGEALRGSNALIGGVDVIVELKRVGSFGDPTLRKLEATGRFSATPDELFLRLTDDGFEAVHDAASAAASLVKDSLVGAIEDGVSELDALSDFAGISKKTATKHLRELESEQRVRQQPGSGVRGRPLSFLPWTNTGTETFHLSGFQEELAV